MIRNGRAFSVGPAVRAAVRVCAGRITAAPYGADDLPVQSSLDFGPIDGANLDAMFAHIQWVFDVPEIRG